MTQYIQDELPGMSEVMARAESLSKAAEIDETTRQMHLVHMFCRWGKYANFSKDPEFKKRCEARRVLLTKLMCKRTAVND